MDAYRDPYNSFTTFYTYDYTYDYTYVPYKSQYEKPSYNSSEISLCIFLIISVCVGLPALVWAFRLLHLHRKIRGRISAFIVLLLLSDLIQLLINIYTVIELLKRDIYWFPGITLQICSGLSLNGFLHQLVALEGVLRLKYPLCSARICSLPCYIMISILVIVFSTVIVFIFFMHLSVTMSSFSLGTCLACLSLLLVTFTITCKSSSTPVSINTRSILIVAIVNFVMLYLPFMLVICVYFFTMHMFDLFRWLVMSLCLMSLRVISDPILCVLVCRGDLRAVQTPQTHTEHNADETSV